jgi:hypothetical protein
MRETILLTTASVVSARRRSKLIDLNVAAPLGP